MSFEWNNMHGLEERIEGEITDSLYEAVCSFYEVDDVIDLTEEQLKEIEAFRDEHVHEYALVQVAFSNLISWWEGNNGM